MPKRRKRHAGPTPPKVYGLLAVDEVEEAAQNHEGGAESVAELIGGGFLTPLTANGATIAYAMTAPRRSAGVR